MPKTLPCCTPDTTLTSLLRQPPTITCCDRFDRNCVNIDTVTTFLNRRTPLAKCLRNNRNIMSSMRCARGVLLTNKNINVCRGVVSITQFIRILIHQLSLQQYLQPFNSFQFVALGRTSHVLSRS